jgi:hypothetical protein
MIREMMALHNHTTIPPTKKNPDSPLGTRRRGSRTSLRISSINSITCCDMGMDSRGRKWGLLLFLLTAAPILLNLYSPPTPFVKLVASQIRSPRMALLPSFDSTSSFTLACLAPAGSSRE